jgi:hypothetical protein
MLENVSISPIYFVCENIQRFLLSLLCTDSMSISKLLHLLSTYCPPFHSVCQFVRYGRHYVCRYCFMLHNKVNSDGAGVKCVSEDVLMGRNMSFGA